MASKWVAPSIRIPLEPQGRPPQIPQPLPRVPVYLSAAAKQRDQIASDQQPASLDARRLFELVNGAAPPAPGRAGAEALPGIAPPLAGQRLCYEEALGHAPSLAEYQAIVKLHREVQRRSRLGSSRAVALPDKSAECAPDAGADGVSRSQSPAPAGAPKGAQGADASRSAPDSTSSFDAFVAEQGMLYAADLLRSRSGNQRRAHREGALGGEAPPGREAAEGEAAAAGGGVEAKGLDLSVSFVLGPRAAAPSARALSPMRGSHGAHYPPYHHSERVLHFGSAPEVHERALAALAERLRQSQPVFSALSQREMVSVLGAGSTERLGRYTSVYRQGSLAQSLFLLLDGQLALHEADGSATRLRSPSYAPVPKRRGAGLAGEEGRHGPILFGLDCFSDCPVRLGSVSVEAPALVMALHVDSLPAACAAACREELHVRLLGSVPLLQGARASLKVLRRLVPLVCLRSYPLDALLLRQGSAADRFFILLKGSVAVLFEERPDDAVGAPARPGAEAPASGPPGRAVELRTLSAGGATSFFGEVALVRAQPHGASVVAKETVFTLEMEADGFKLMLRALPELREQFELAVKRWLHADSLRRSGDLLRASARGAGGIGSVTHPGGPMQQKVVETLCTQTVQRAYLDDPSARPSVAQSELERRARREDAIRRREAAMLEAEARAGAEDAGAEADVVS